MLLVYISDNQRNLLRIAPRVVYHRISLVTIIFAATNRKIYDTHLYNHNDATDFINPFVLFMP